MCYNYVRDSIIPYISLLCAIHCCTLSEAIGSLGCTSSSSIGSMLIRQLTEEQLWPRFQESWLRWFFCPLDCHLSQLKPPQYKLCSSPLTSFRKQRFNSLKNIWFYRYSLLQWVAFYDCREERVVYRKGTFWQHCATYLLYFIGLMNVFITTFGISGGHYGSIILPAFNNTSNGNTWSCDFKQISHNAFCAPTMHCDCNNSVAAALFVGSAQAFQSVCEKCKDLMS